MSQDLNLGARYSLRGYGNIHVKTITVKKMSKNIIFSKIRLEI